jgi:hypothetical protein
MAAWRRFVAWVSALAENEAAPLWQAALAEAYKETGRCFAATRPPVTSELSPALSLREDGSSPIGF